eukprot:1967856-Rhodomonas_salina.1
MLKWVSHAKQTRCETKIICWMKNSSRRKQHCTQRLRALAGSTRKGQDSDKDRPARERGAPHHSGTPDLQQMVLLWTAGTRHSPHEEPGDVGQKQPWENSMFGCADARQSALVRGTWRRHLIAAHTAASRSAIGSFAMDPKNSFENTRPTSTDFSESLRLTWSRGGNYVSLAYHTSPNQSRICPTRLRSLLRIVSFQRRQEYQADRDASEQPLHNHLLQVRHATEVERRSGLALLLPLPILSFGVDTSAASPHVPASAAP